MTKTNAQKSAEASVETDAALKANNADLTAKAATDAPDPERGKLVGAALNASDRERIRMINKKAAAAIAAEQSFIGFVGGEATDVAAECDFIRDEVNARARVAIRMVEEEALAR